GSHVRYNSAFTKQYYLKCSLSNFYIATSEKQYKTLFTSYIKTCIIIYRLPQHKSAQNFKIITANSKSMPF
ncbi:MAG TPA: hypothetical protein PKE17_01185, partial [Saprospiraceae bacterium]|nr:hypothetical protein [Saprospiraceae bacterium]